MDWLARFHALGVYTVGWNGFHALGVYITVVGWNDLHQNNIFDYAAIEKC